MSPARLGVKGRVGLLRSEQRRLWPVKSTIGLDLTSSVFDRRSQSVGVREEGRLQAAISTQMTEEERADFGPLIFVFVGFGDFGAPRADRGPTAGTYLEDLERIRID